MVVSNIRIFRAGRQAAEIDLYEYLMKGNSMSDITLQDGDIVMVEPFGYSTGNRRSAPPHVV